MVATISDMIINRLRKGEENAVPRAELVSLTGLPSRHVERVIERLRRQKVVICSSGRGYFYPASREELEAYVRREAARAKSIRTNISPARSLLRQWEDH